MLTRVRQIGVVEGVEHLQPELVLEAVPETRGFHQPQVHVQLAGLVQDTAPGIPVGAGVVAGGGERGRASRPGHFRDMLDDTASKEESVTLRRLLFAWLKERLLSKIPASSEVRGSGPCRTMMAP